MSRRQKWVVWSAGVAAVVLALLIWAVVTAPEHPVALIRVVDSAGRPVEGAVIKPDGMRTKPGPYQSGHYAWRQEVSALANIERKTDRAGAAQVPYPKYVFEKIETGQISFSVSHPDFVPDRPFRVVSTAPPAGAPLKVWLSYFTERIKNRALVAPTDPVVLKRGAALQVSTDPGEGELFAQVSGMPDGRRDFWTRVDANTLLARQVPEGARLVRLVRLEPHGRAQFSEVAKIEAVAERTRELRLPLRPGLTLRGKLGQAVPRPVTSGRVIAKITSLEAARRDNPPQWHTWTLVEPDGTFVLSNLPPGELEISALCDGFLSVSGPGRGSMIYPQKHQLESSDLDIVLEMEPTARLEVTVLDDAGKPLAGARVHTWPNIQYGGYSATVFASDCYHTAEVLRTGRFARRSPADFTSTSDASGLAVLPNLPPNVSTFSVDHPGYQLPATDTGGGQKRRQASVRLTPGETNTAVVRLEPRDTAPIAHY